MLSHDQTWMKIALSAYELDEHSLHKKSKKTTKAKEMLNLYKSISLPEKQRWKKVMREWETNITQI